MFSLFFSLFSVQFFEKGVVNLAVMTIKFCDGLIFISRDGVMVIKVAWIRW